MVYYNLSIQASGKLITEIHTIEHDNANTNLG